MVDGDTFHGREVHSDELIKVRLYGINAPERGQAGYTEARDFLVKETEGKTVTISAVDIDRFSRTVASVYTSLGSYVNAELVISGVARWYKRYARYDKVMQDSEQEAKLQRRGLWKDFFDEF